MCCYGNLLCEEGPGQIPYSLPHSQSEVCRVTPLVWHILRCRNEETPALLCSGILYNPFVWELEGEKWKKLGWRPTNVSLLWRARRKKSFIYEIIDFTEYPPHFPIHIILLSLQLSDTVWLLGFRRGQLTSTPEEEARISSRGGVGNYLIGHNYHGHWRLKTSARIIMSVKIMSVIFSLGPRIIISDNYFWAVMSVNNYVREKWGPWKKLSVIIMIDKVVPWYLLFYNLLSEYLIVNFAK